MLLEQVKKAGIFEDRPARGAKEEELAWWGEHYREDFDDGPADDIILDVKPERKKQVTIRLEPSLVEALKELAAAHHLPYQTLARHLIKLGLRKFCQEGRGQ